MAVLLLASNSFLISQTRDRVESLIMGQADEAQPAATSSTAARPASAVGVARRVRVGPSVGRVVNDVTAEIAGGSMTPQQIVAAHLAGLLMWLIYRVSFTDMSPFRAIRRESARALRR